MKYTVSTDQDIKNVNIKTKDGIAMFTWADQKWLTA